MADELIPEDLPRQVTAVDPATAQGVDPRTLPTQPEVAPQPAEKEVIGEIDLDSSEKPDPEKQEVTDQALESNKRYHDTQDLIWAGRLQGTAEFLPGRKLKLHTPDQGEVMWIGKRLDQEFGKIDLNTGLSATYDQGIQLFTLSIIMDTLDGVSVYDAESPSLDPNNPALSASEREFALDRKSMVVRNTMQYWFPHVIDRMYKFYRSLYKEQELALKLLPFYSAIGENLKPYDPSIEEDFSIQGVETSWPG